MDRTGKQYEQTYEQIARLAALRGITGREEAVGETAAEMLRAFVPDAAFRDGSVTAHLGQDSDKPTLLLCSHLDQVGFLVTDITEDGFLRIGAVGGIDRRILLGQRVTVTGSDGSVCPGVISILPPHLLKGEQAVPDEAQLCVDLGFSAKKQLAGRIRPGDAVYYDAPCMRLQGDRMTGAALDDRCGVAALLLAAGRLAEEKSLPCNVTFVLSGQEERSGRGAKLAAMNEPADAAIAVDVTFGMAHGEDPHDCTELGKGPAIGISPVLSLSLSDALIAVAEQAKIPYQTEIMPGRTGTDADALALAPGGCAAGTVSVPLRSMHTPVEVIALSDIAQTAELLVQYALSFREKEGA